MKRSQCDTWKRRTIMQRSHWCSLVFVDECAYTAEKLEKYCRHKCLYQIFDWETNIRIMNNNRDFGAQIVN